ncbi:DUF6415 family natural product biosynthesis protein [Streptomyces purpureus]|uniref:DUF6415 family natural product biosynthesis protein n=1 Tax=Streptomyces purpureus TaxID=1951 RepID=UPI00037168B1|nr:DUF6415 family natural product biosynthesis protein [Streptomyces purpureus]
MQERHDRPTEHAEVSLGSFLAVAADAIEEHVEDVARRDIRRALTMRNHPGDKALAYLNGRLVAHCKTLATGVRAIPERRRTVRGVRALETWTELAEAGPAGGPLGTWSYAHHLAQTARDMLDEIRAYRQHQKAKALVGRAELPHPADSRGDSAELDEMPSASGARPERYAHPSGDPVRQGLYGVH